MRNTPPANGAPWDISPPTSGGKYRARVWPNVQYAWKPCMLVVLSRPVTPSSLELCQEIGNVRVVLISVLYAQRLWVQFQKESASRSRYLPMDCCNPVLNWLRWPGWMATELAPKTLWSSPPTPVALESSRFSLNGVSKVLA